MSFNAGFVSVVVAGAAMAVGGCSSTRPAQPDTAGAAVASSPPGAKAFAELKPTQGNGASGIVWMEQHADQVEVRARVSGLRPGQEHAIHVHEKGDCSSADASSAGGHLNPKGKPHGPPDGEHHPGDLPSLKADASGVAQARFSVPGTLTGSGAADFVGKSVIVHADRDDYATQPSGNSGARIACGVVMVPTSGMPGMPKGIPNEM
jgi:superoxide dismutase, Cu-Zn family